MHVIIHLSKPVEYITPRVNLTINYGLWTIIIYQSRFIDCNKFTALVQDSIVEEAVLVWEQRVYSLYFLLNFAVNLKLL